MASSKRRVPWILRPQPGRQPDEPSAPSPPSRIRLAHLASDWIALATQIERGEFTSRELLMQAATLRLCAKQLRNMIGIPQDRTQ